MCRKLIYLVSFVLVLGLAVGVIKDSSLSFHSAKTCWAVRFSYFTAF